MIQDKKNNYAKYTNQELTVERVAVACQPQKYSIREYHTHVLAAFQFIDDCLYLFQSLVPDPCSFSFLLDLLGPIVKVAGFKIKAVK